MNELFARYPALSVCEESICKALELMIQTYRAGGKILLCGNGGSCADCDHIVGELMKGFLSPRPIAAASKEAIARLFPEEAEYLASHLQEGIPAISLPSQGAVLSAFANDVVADMVYAQLVYGCARPGDLVVGLSTSGNSANVVNAIKVARALGIETMALTGARSCKLDALCSVVIKVPETETYKVQEYHLPVYHYLCAELEKTLFEKEARPI